MGTIPLSSPHFAGNEVAYVTQCIETGWVAGGAFIEDFEERVSSFLGKKRAVATASGTAALHVTLRVIGIEPGDEVIIPTLTFVAPSNAIRYVGAQPVFMDVDPVYWQIDVEKLSDFFKEECRPSNRGLLNRSTGRPVKAVIAVDLMGHPVDMDSIVELCRQYDVVVVEDAAESLGALYRGKKVGALADVACLSFNGNKVITSGAGGMVVTDNEVWADRVKYFIDQAKDDPAEYYHGEIGYNYRITNVHAAIGLAQMEKLHDHVAAKRSLAAYYNKGFTGIEGITPQGEADWAKSIFWLYTVLVDPDLCGTDRRRLMVALQNAGIQTRPLWVPNHLLPAHNQCQAYRITIADRIHQKGLSLPSSVGITEDERAFVVEQVVRAVGG
jgi:perosamine synthetase